jgi:hypothetical protein
MSFRKRDHGGAGATALAPERAAPRKPRNPLLIPSASATSSPWRRDHYQLRNFDSPIQRDHWNRLRHASSAAPDGRLTCWMSSHQSHFFAPAGGRDITAADPAGGRAGNEIASKGYDQRSIREMSGDGVPRRPGALARSAERASGQRVSDIARRAGSRRPTPALRILAEEGWASATRA